MNRTEPEPRFDEPNPNLTRSSVRFGSIGTLPDEYLVKTEYGKMEKHILNCSIKYNNQNPEFYLSWKDRENQHHQVNSKTTPTKAAQKYLEVFSMCDKYLQNSLNIKY